MPRLPFFAALLLFAVSALAAPASAGDENLTRSISVSGTGLIKAKPDQAQIQIGVTSEAETAARAMKDNNKSMMAVFEAMASMGIVNENIQTSNFMVGPQYAPYNSSSKEPAKIIGYRVSNTVSIITNDLDGLGKVLDRLVTVGANQVNGISFGFSDSSALENLARNTAVQDARAKAELYAEASGVELGEVLMIQEGAISVPMPMARMSMAACDESVPISVGQESVSAQINITYAIK